MRGGSHREIHSNSEDEGLRLFDRGFLHDFRRFLDDFSVDFRTLAGLALRALLGLQLLPFAPRLFALPFCE